MIAVFVCCMGQLSCSKQELQQAFDNAKETAQQATVKVSEAAKEVLPESGHIDLQFANPDHPLAKVSAKRTRIQIFPIGLGRPNAVHVSNMVGAFDQTSMPRILLTGSSKFERISDLSNTTLTCQLFVQVSEDLVAITKPGNQFELKFGQHDVQQNAISGKIGPGVLLDSEGDEIEILGGDFMGTVEL